MRAKRTILNSVAAGAVMILFYFAVNHRFDWTAPRLLLLNASNACSIAGVLLILGAGARWLQKHHMLDWVSYALYQARFLLLKHKAQSYTNFYDYRAEKEKEYQRFLVWPVFWVGAFFVCLGVLLSLMFIAQAA